MTAVEQLVPAYGHVFTKADTEQIADEVKAAALEALQQSEVPSDYESRRAIFAGVASRVIRSWLTKALTEKPANLSHRAKEKLVHDMVNQAMGLGVITDFLDRRHEISDVFLNGTASTRVIYNNGVREQQQPRFRTVEDALRWAQGLGRTFGNGAQLTRQTPELDLKLPYGIRFNAGMCVNYGVTISLRIPNRQINTLETLVQNHTLNKAQFLFLKAAVAAKLNLIIAGGTGAGKTTLMRCMLTAVDSEERIITIEDRAELDLQTYVPSLDVVELEASPPNTDGIGEVTTRQLLRGALRKRPDRIIVGEVRDEIAREMLQAMSTGEEGSMSTLHARTVEAVVDRLVECSGLEPARVKSSIRNSLNLIIHVAEDPLSRERKITSIKQVDPINHGTGEVHLTDLFNSSGSMVHHPVGEVRERLTLAGWGS